MTKNPLSIVIPCHRRIDLLRLCLQSVATYAPKQTEILVVDDASPQEIVGEVACEYPNVRTIRLKKKSGFCVAINRGIQESNGEIVEVLNDDTQVTPGWAERALEGFDHPSVGAVAPLVLLGPDNEAIPRIDSAGDEYDFGGFARKRGHGQRLSDDFQQRMFVFGASGSSAFYRRSALERVGLFPTHFGAYFEDVDLSCRLNREGYRVLYEPLSRVWHRGGSSYRKKNRKVIEIQSRNEELLFWRNLPSHPKWKAIVRHTAVLAGKSIRRWREGTFLPFLLGRIRALLGRFVYANNFLTSSP